MGPRVRAVFVAAAVAFLVSLFGTPMAIRIFTRLKAGQPIRTDGPQTHLGKKGTPTMGGVVFIVATLIAYVAGHLALTTLPAQQLVQIGPTITALVLLGLLVFCGVVGFIDDFLKVRQAQQRRPEQARQAHRPAARRRDVRHHRAVLPEHDAARREARPTPRRWPAPRSRSSATPNWLDISKVGAVILFVFVVMAMSNAVNLTDGLDGLATGASIDGARRRTR